jgi:hypothetical protein
LEDVISYYPSARVRCNRRFKSHLDRCRIGYHEYLYDLPNPGYLDFHFSNGRRWRFVETWVCSTYIRDSIPSKVLKR